MSLPEVEPEPAAEPMLEPEIPPAPDYRGRLREAIEQAGRAEPTAGEPGDLYRDEGMSDEEYNAMNERWKAGQERRQRQAIRRGTSPRWTSTRPPWSRGPPRRRRSG